MLEIYFATIIKFQSLVGKTFAKLNFETALNLFRFSNPILL